MSSDSVFLTCASWEPRFVEGFNSVVHREQPKTVILFWFFEYRDRSHHNSTLVQSAHKGLQINKVCLYMSARSVKEGTHHSAIQRNMESIYEELLCHFNNGRRFVLDISTMPRETIWMVLSLLHDFGSLGRIYYFKASKHGSWCGCEPERPHIVPRLGGVAKIGAPILLVVAEGFDADRSEQFIACYEPSTIVVFQQINPPDSPDARLVPKIRSQAKSQNIQYCQIDFFSADWGFSTLYNNLKPLAHASNILLASLGPKTSAISLFLLQRKISNSSLVYAPCRDYNQDYSSGLGSVEVLDWSPNELP